VGKISRENVKFCHLTILFFALALLAVDAIGATYYVDANGTGSVSPYADWSTAAANIQDAANLAANGDTILVTNGVYQSGGASFNGSNRVYVAQGVFVQSMNGPAVTTIVGYQVPGTTNGNNALRCVYLSANSTFSGFTLTNGATQSVEGEGGGVYMQSNTLVTNCVIVGNVAENDGGACVAKQGGNVVNCIIRNNLAPFGSAVSGCIVNDSLITGNGTTNLNSAVYGGTLSDCTIAGNYSSGLGAAQGCRLANCIIYSNICGISADCYQCLLTNCCTPIGNGNGTEPNSSISNAPAFVDAVHGNYHLQIGSPCIDAGTNALATTATDLDGNPRIVNGTVDMGCYESESTNVVHFVSLSSTNPVAPYTNWPTAATNIQDAVGAAQTGEIVVVNSGIYSNGVVVISGTETNVVALTNGITLLGLYGPKSTIIAGQTQTRCVYVGSNSVLSGFTLTNGHARTAGDPINERSGGGIWCQPGALVFNCLVISNSTIFSGTYNGGLGGGVYGGTISNCTLALNSAGSGGGAGAATLWNCILTNNIANGGGGAGASLLYGCFLSNNVAAYNGNIGLGGALSNCVAYSCTMINSSNSTFASSGGGTYRGTNFNCSIIGNTAGSGGGTYLSTNYSCVILSNNATMYGAGAYQGTLYNCLLAYNIASNSISFYGEGGGTYQSTLYDCTVVTNSGTGGGGGIYSGTAYNSILFFNTVTGAVQNAANAAQIFYSCIAPTVPQTYDGFDITNDPMFVNAAAGDFHLQYNSPCINAGANAWVFTTNDLDGNPRITGYAVDMGAYEKTPASIIPNWWLFKYGLTNDGSADNVDLDGTGVVNWQKWKAGLNPTNAASVLAMSPPPPLNNASGITVTWQSVTDIVYYVQQSTNLSALPAFYPIQSNLMGQAGTTSFTDTSATNAGPYFYRIGVQ
jgi:hypothetical protein